MRHEPNPEQERAVAAPGDVAVTASAGTGKTATLAARYVRHVVDDGLSPLRVVAATFTERAATELRQRVRAALAGAAGVSAERLAEVEAAPIGTLHALAARICREHHQLAGVAPDFTIVTEEEPDLWSAEQVESTLLELAPDVLAADGALPWSVARQALRAMLREPYLAARALERVPESLEAAREAWSAVAGELRRQAWDELLDSAWQDAAARARTTAGPPGDLLELKRQALVLALDALDQAVDEPARLAALGQLAELKVGNAGSPKAWGDDDFIGFRQALARLVNRAKAALKDGIIAVSLGPADDRLHAQLLCLRALFPAADETLRERKRQLGVLSYQDLELGALRALGHDEVRRWYAARWRAVLLDEAQDTNPTQAALLAELRRFDPPRLSLVGDAKQMIYGFRGVREGQLEALAEGVASRHALRRTYRHHAALAEQLNTIFAPLFGQAFEPVRSDDAPPGSGPWIELALVAEPGDEEPRRLEARDLAARLTELCAAGVAPREVAVLARGWASLEPIAEALVEVGLPCHLAGGGSLLETREAQDAEMLLRAVADDADRLAWAALLRSPFVALSDRELLDVARAAGDGPWREQLHGPAARILDRLHAARRGRPSRLLRLADELSGYSAVLAHLPQPERRLADWHGLLDLVRRLETPSDDLAVVVRRLRALRRLGSDIRRPPLAGGEAVTLSTIHGAKGLEWRVVAVPDMAGGAASNRGDIPIEPHAGIGLPAAPGGEKPVLTRWLGRLDAARARHELLRLGYVALTRARERLLLSAADAKQWAPDKGQGTLLGVLRPGLAALGLEPRRIDAAALAPPAGPPIGLSPARAELAPEPIAIGPSEVPMAALNAYRACPRRFEFAVVRGHPGGTAGDEAGYGRRVGELVHWALEHGQRRPEELARRDGSLPAAELARALECLRRLDDDPAFAPIRGLVGQPEVDCRLCRAGVRLVGRIDLLGDDFVVDYKTGAEVAAERHELQLWAYARAAGRPRAWVADLTQGVAHQLGEADLDRLDGEAAAVLAGIRAGRFEPLPEPAKCARCAFAEVCEARAG